MLIVKSRKYVVEHVIPTCTIAALHIKTGFFSIHIDGGRIMEFVCNRPRLLNVWTSILDRLIHEKEMRVIDKGLIELYRVPKKALARNHSMDGLVGLNRVKPDALPIRSKSSATMRHSVDLARDDKSSLRPTEMTSRSVSSLAYSSNRRRSIYGTPHSPILKPSNVSPFWDVVSEDIRIGDKDIDRIFGSIKSVSSSSSTLVGSVVSVAGVSPVEDDKKGGGEVVKKGVKGKFGRILYALGKLLLNK
jgi:hypothetical protein